VLDFGLVKEHASEAPAGLSMEGALLGTPAYLAPESIMDPSQVDARSDLYAVGAVAYYLLVGEPVFASQSVVEVCAHHLHTTPLPPSERLPTPISGALEGLILRCLAKTAAARPASAAELLVLLDQLDDVGVWSTKDAENWWQEHAAAIRQLAKASRVVGSTPGPRTVAVDLDQRLGSRVRPLNA
jgi:eukaryotic-like serine/threonine-protein kinase